MFKKRNRNFRERRKDSVSDDEQTNEATSSDQNKVLNGSENTRICSNEIITIKDDEDQTEPTQVPKKSKKKKEKTKTMPTSSSVLSFVEDEGDDPDSAFKIKKPTHSKRVAKQLKKLMLQEKEEAKSTTPSSSPKNIYTDESLQELKDEKEIQNGWQLGSPGRPDDDFSDEDADRKEPTFKDLIQSGQIPDASMIHAIRKRRQLAREQGDFIPLDDTVRADKAEKSRLVREDENDVSDEDADRIDFTVTANREKELRHIQATIIQAHEDSDAEESNHEWETQQIRKGVSIPTQQQLGEASIATDSPITVQDCMYGNPDMSGFHIGGPQAFEGATEPSKRTIPMSDLPKINLALIKKRLAERLDEMRSLHRAHVNERDDLSSRYDDSQSIIDDSGGKRESLENDYKFFQEMRGYVTDLVECLNEKVPMIQHLERSMTKQWQKRAERIAERRQQDVKDEAQDCLMTMDKNKAIDPSTQSEDKLRRFAEREARRTRRRRKRESRDVPAPPHDDGMSTDDEQNPSELAHFNSEKDRVTLEVSRLWEDVEPEYHEIAAIRRRFERWRREQPESYNEAYIALCLPKLLTPFVRLKLVAWNPLESHCKDFTTDDWYECLIFYGHGLVDGDSEATIASTTRQRCDDDMKVIPSLIERLVIPRMTTLVESVWQPLSSRQTQNLVTCLTQLISRYPTLSADSKQTKALIKAVVTRMRKTLDDDIFMPLYPKQLLEAKGPAATFFTRQFWQCFKMLRSMLLWQGIISDAALMEMSLDALLNRYIMLALQNSPGPLNDDTLRRAGMIASLFPKAWFSKLTSDSTIPQLNSFCRYLVSSAKQLDQIALTAAAAGKMTQQRNAREKLKQIAKILLNIHAMDHSMQLASEYSFKLQQL